MNDQVRAARADEGGASPREQRSRVAAIDTHACPRPLEAGKSSRMFAAGRDLLKDAIAGLLASTVLVANIVSFAALMFPGTLGAGIPVAIWAMLIGSCVGGVVIASTTSLAPIATGIDSPTAAVLVLLSASAASGVAASGGTSAAAVQTVMLLFTAATFVSGAVLYGLGALRLGSYLRFVPYFVVGGFLAATGWFLIAGGVRMTLGAPVGFDVLGTRPTELGVAKLLSAAAVLLVLLAVRRWMKSPFAMPVALVAMWLGGEFALRAAGLSAYEHGWRLPSLGTLAQWAPLEAVRTTHLTVAMILRLLPELLAVTIVGIISLVTKVSSLEVARQASGDLDRELRAHGAGSLLAAPLGGLTSSLQPGTSRLLEHAGGATRLSGVACALAIGAVGLAQFDLPSVIPVPMVAGLVFYLGYTFIADALARPYAQRAWLDLLLSVAIVAVCIAYGYLVGVLVGIVGACILFAMTYARLGVVRRHASRAQFAGDVYRSTEASRYLRENGDLIRLYWLSGYIFFGSSEGVFERIRGEIESAAGPVRYVILDFAMVPGADSSAVASFAKLRSFCERHRITLAYCALSPRIRAMLERGRFFGGNSRHRAFADVNVALAWCEDVLLAEAKLDVKSDFAAFDAWIEDQLGSGVSARDLIGYLERTEADRARVLYRQGEPADTVDLVAAGSLDVEIAKSDGATVRVRRIATHAVVGEMGFFRRSLRSATVSCDGPATLFTLTRTNFERMRRERPDVASAFYDFIIRVLSERIDSANRALTAFND